jgi:NAD(P)-dependent dehydrogenase (short-subunit alcohol dehydrogenase family)
MALGDLADPQTAAHLRDTALAQHGRLDALVANAGFADRAIGELSRRTGRVRWMPC